MKIDDVKRIIAENKIKMDFIRINDNYLISGIYYLYYDDSSLNWAAFHYDREYNADQIQVLEGLEAVRVRPRYVYCKYFTKRTSPFGLRNC